MADFEPRGGVHGVAERGVLDPPLAAEIADHRLAAVKSDPGAADRRHVGAGAAAEFLAGLVHGDRGEGGAVGIVVAGDRRAPEGDDGVADELVDRPAVARTTSLSMSR